MLLSFRLNDMAEIAGGPRHARNGGTRCRRNSPAGAPNRFRDAGFRAVPGAIVRRSAYIAPNVVLMPSFVNVGAYVDSGTMVDTWATVGSCAQIGKNCHLSGGVGIGGVLEPLQAEPVIIEDDCFIGARSEVVEGVIVEKGAVLAMGTFISSTTKIVNRATGEIHLGRVPAYSVVVPGSLPGKPLPNGEPGPEPLLRGDRQDRSTRRPAPRPRSTNSCATDATMPRICPSACPAGRPGTHEHGIGQALTPALDACSAGCVEVRVRICDAPRNDREGVEIAMAARRPRSRSPPS